MHRSHIPNLGRDKNILLQRGIGSVALGIKKSQPIGVQGLEDYDKDSSCKEILRSKGVPPAILGKRWCQGEKNELVKRKGKLRDEDMAIRKKKKTEKKMLSQRISLKIK